MTKDIISNYFNYKKMVYKIYKNKTDDLYENCILACFSLQQLLYETYILKILEKDKEIKELQAEIEFQRDLLSEPCNECKKRIEGLK